MSDVTRGSVRDRPTRAEEILAVGLRDEKRRQTRRHIAEVATGLFLERGFAQVTIAEVARTAEVSVNTVYTYFPSKEDLVFYPEEASAQRMVQMVGDRLPGESAADAVLGALRGELRNGDRMVGLTQGFGRFLEMVRAEPTLAVRLDSIGREMVDRLAAVLAAETGAEAGDPLPRLVAAQLGWVQEQLFREIGDRTRAGEAPGAVAEAALALLDTVESLLGPAVRGYARR
ncbi:TetR/AcrR family transcriptional regulator [Actinacidiphila sp. DG2A-62]|uniref:TetR/AcrR family transcriptional regulator n=1 Tax=Actinacidiphila sp. DG2A-62 TaxID=3108821 RepID=UPI002DBFFBC0|nr:TetR/AcrR family transcriptional regulator [Actinacidiphila sp. DG2A-62]MEC3996597.1 TetR/AcrR family transcriptional regulator [Actinacidiphila sp. DG2A-62]